MVEIALGRRGVPRRVLVLITAMAAALAPGSAGSGRAAEPARGCRVFLTFDVELEEDIEALRLLDPPAPCTLFITGEFAEAYPEAVRAWSKRHEIGCHTMSHPHMTGLDAAAQEEEIRRSAAILQRLSGAKCLGFRAPYLEANATTRQALVRLGFRYQSSTWDSDDQVRSSSELLEFPITDQAGDYNLFELDKLGEAEVLKRLLALHAERSLSGRPMVVLLHPHTIAQHAGVLRQFIEHVGRQPERWGCFRDWLDEAGLRRPGRRALWVDTKAIPYEAQDIVASAQLVGITDLFVQVYDPTEGPLFGPGRPHDDYVNGMIDEAHARGMRVHAWFPICFDPLRLRQHPEWGMVNARGQHSADFVCPTNAPWRQQVLDTFQNLVESYGVDGIHLDDLRFPDAESCQCPACRAELARRVGKDWPLGLALDDKPELRRVWWDYRADLIRNLTAALAGAARDFDDHLVISAAVRPEGAVDSRGVQLAGQSYEKLAPLLDFLVPMAYHRRDDQPLAWVKAVQLSGQWRAGSTPVWIGIQAFEEPGRPPSSLEEFGSLLEVVRHGSAGVVLCSYASLFSLAIDDDSPSNLKPGAADLVRRWSLSHRVGPADHAAGAPAAERRTTPAADRAVRSTPPPRPGDASGPVAWVLAGAGLAAALVILVLRLRDRRRPPVLPDLPLSALECLAGEPALRGDQALFITQSLQRLEAAEVDRIRSDTLLLRIHEAGGDLPAEASAEDPAGPIQLQCALRAGLVREASGCWRLTPAGSDRLRRLLAEETDRAWEQFVEDRLEESLQVTCPHCGATPIAHWLRPTVGCPSCHRRFSLRECATVVPHRRRPLRSGLGAY
ncbi:MAG TPA: polysaccharide deacetylase family protein [Isosphaeraceae bacterium]|nr:polysaccharide deacetylase family protein [Isosphaeraceae bacterium]